MRSRFLQWTAAVLAIPASLSAQSGHTVLFRGLPGGFGTLEEVDPAAANAVTRPLGPAPLRLLWLEANGRTELARTDLATAWRHDDVPGASRVQLPAGRGSLYHYELAVGGAARGFGFFRIDADGRARSLIERKGTGPLSDQDPFLLRIGAARDGRSILCATTLDAGGDLLEVDLDTGAVQDRTGAVPPCSWHAGSLFLAPQWGLATHQGGVHFFARAPGAQSNAVDFGLQSPAWFSGDVALAARGTFAAFVAGASPTAADVYVLSPQGGLARATPQPAAISPAGYLPEQLDGPFLAVADDGSHCGWRTEGLAREAFLGRVPWQTAPAAAQLTADVNFIDTIDEVAQFAFRPNGAFRFTAGERALAAGGVDKIDVFQATLPSGGPTALLSNLSQSSGILAPPFLLPGAIRPEGALELPSGLGRLFLDRNQDRLVLFAPQGGPPAPVLADVKAFEGAARSGDRWILLLRRTTGGQARQVHAWSPSAPFATQLLHSSTAADSYDSLTVRGDRCAFFERRLTAVDLFVGDLAAGSVHAFPLAGASFGPGLALAPTGELALNLGAPPAAAAFLSWVPGNLPERLGPVSGPGFVLRGL